MAHLNPYTRQLNLFKYYSGAITSTKKKSPSDQIYSNIALTALSEYPLEFLSFFSTPIFMTTVVLKAFLMYRDYEKTSEISDALDPDSGPLKASEMIGWNSLIDRAITTSLFALSIAVSQLAKNAMLTYFLVRTVVSAMNNFNIFKEVKKCDGDNLELMESLGADIQGDYDKAEARLVAQATPSY